MLKTTACSTNRRKKYTLIATVTAAIVFFAVTAVLLSANPGIAVAQGGQGGRGGPGGQGERPEHPLMLALDLDEDGALSAGEIEGASAALLTLDADGDGALSEDELRPPRPEGSAPPARG